MTLQSAAAKVCQLDERFTSDGEMSVAIDQLRAALAQPPSEDVPDWSGAALETIHDYCEHRTDATARFCYGAAYMAMCQKEVASGLYVEDAAQPPDDATKLIVELQQRLKAVREFRVSLVSHPDGRGTAYWIATYSAVSDLDAVLQQGANG